MKKLLIICLIFKRIDMNKILFDIETDGLNPNNIWCIVAKPQGEAPISFRPKDIEKGIEFLNNAEVLIGHNITGFDIPVIKRLYGVDLFENKKIEDTLIMSRLFNPVREGGHGLKNWGSIVNFPKADQPESWDRFTEEMLKYCKQDVVLNSRVYSYLLKEGKDFSKESIELEHETSIILRQQERNGFLFNLKKATLLVSSLKERMFEVKKEVHNTFKPKWVDDKLVSPDLKKDGTLSKRGLTAEEYNKILTELTLLRSVNGIQEEDFKNPKPKPFMRKKLREFNLGSRKQIGEYLQDFGWKPNKFTPTGQPIINELSLAKIKHIPEAKLIAEFLLLQKRIAQIDSWIEAVEKDNRVHGFVIPNGTITGRMSHRKPNMAQVPSVASEYGKECRECWTVDEGYKLIGIDASGLELRMLAHYMKDERYIHEILEGDIHTFNQKLAGLKSRDTAKTFIYALIYGAGDEKIGKVVGGNNRVGSSLRRRFLNNQPSLKALQNKAKRTAKRGHLKGLDGRKIFIRNDYAALNFLLQSGGAIAMKRALIILNKKANKRNLDFKFVANIHDEWQVEVHEAHAEYFGKLGVEAIKEAGKYYNLRCPLDAEYKIGNTWNETH